jgi:hypothetical protein
LLFLGTLVLFSHSFLVLGQLVGERAPHVPTSVNAAPDGLKARIGDESLHISVCADSVIHVLAGLRSRPTDPPFQPWLLGKAKSCPGAAGPLFKQGWDAFWLHSAEPEEYWPHMGDAILRDKQLSFGSGARYTNIFPLMHTGGIQEHWRRETDQKRVFLLTRSAFLGQQRNGATVWSGDVYRQPFERPPDDPAYQELYTRWFEFGVFCPIFRTHGHRAANEIWTYTQVKPLEKSCIEFPNRRMLSSVRGRLVVRQSRLPFSRTIVFIARGLRPILSAEELRLESLCEVRPRNFVFLD